MQPRQSSVPLHLDLKGNKLDQQFGNMVGKCVVHIYVYKSQDVQCVYVLQLNCSHCATHAEPIFCIYGVGE